MYNIVEELINNWSPQCLYQDFLYYELLFIQFVSNAICNILQTELNHWVIGIKCPLEYLQA